MQKSSYSKKYNYLKTRELRNTQIQNVLQKRGFLEFLNLFLNNSYIRVFYEKQQEEPVIIYKRGKK